MPLRREGLTSIASASSALARNTLLNLAGHVVPLAAAVVAIPFLIRVLGQERFGMLSIAWVLVGYFSLFDLGLGRALTHAVAARAGTLEQESLPALIRKGLAVMLLLGFCAGVALFVLAPWLCRDVLHVSAALSQETIAALRVLSLCLPFVTVTAGLRGILEGKHRFGWVNGIRVPLGLLTFAGPMLIAMADPSLIPVAIVLALVRAIAATAHWLVCAALYPELFRARPGATTGVRSLFKFGAWLTVSNIIGPLMVYSDRFVIGAALGLAAVAYYSAPYEVITRLWLIPAALTAVVFPAFTTHLGAQPQRALEVYRWSLKCIFLAVYPLALFLIVLAPDWLRIWLGAEYAIHSAQPARLLALGVAVNCMAYIPFTLLQSAGRADVPAKLHLAQFPVYIGLLFWLVSVAGLTGAALAWSLRCAVDAMLLFYFARTHLPQRSALLSPVQLMVMAMFAVLLVASVFPVLPSLRLPVFLAGMMLFGVVGWFILLSPAERDLVRHPWLLKQILNRP